MKNHAIIERIFNEAGEIDAEDYSDFKRYAKLVLNHFYGIACIAANKSHEEYRQEYEEHLWSSLHTSEMSFGNIVNELFENSYVDTDSCYKQTSMMDLYGKYMKAINKGVVVDRKGVKKYYIPLKIERVIK